MPGPGPEPWPQTGEEHGLLADVGVFWDFLSLPQQHCDAEERTELEDRLGATAFGNMQLLYGHRLCSVLSFTAMPPPPSPLDRQTQRYDPVALLPTSTRSTGLVLEQC